MVPLPTTIIQLIGERMEGKRILTSATMQFADVLITNIFCHVNSFNFDSEFAQTLDIKRS